MKLRNLFIAAVAGLFGLVACEGVEQDLGVAKISIDPLELPFNQEGGSEKVALTATRDWNVNVSALPEWIALSAAEGKASAKEQTITVTVDPNPDNDREVAIVFNAGMVRATLTVKQAGAKGEIQKGSGTLEDPYSVAGVIEYTQSLGADVQSTDKVYFKGIVSDVATTFEGSGNYGNASFYIVDSEGSTDKFYVFQTYYLGNRQWKSGDTEIKAGDEVIVYGPVVNYKGNTPETVGKGSSFIYSLNGQTEGGVVDEGEAKGDGTLDNPFNPAGAAAYAQSLGSDVQSDKSVYIKGKISKVSTTFEASGNYGNANFYIVDATDGKGEFYIFQTYYLGNRKWAAGDTDVKEGDEVIVYGPVVNYKGNTPETVGKGASYIYSLNGQTGGSDQPGPVEEETTAEVAGDGSQANPFNVAAAIAKAKEVGETATSESYYIKGKVSTVKEAFGTQFGNGTFELVDEGYTAVFTAFRILYFGNQKWVEGNSSIAVGDEIVVVGKIVNYKGNTPETAQGSGYLYSLNGQTGGSDQPGPVEEETTAEPAGDGSQANPFNVAAAIAKAKEVGETATSESYYIKGKVSTVKEAFGTQFGNGTFELIDEGYTAVFTAFRVLYFGNQKWVEGDASVAQGDEIVVVGKIVNYKGDTPETAQGSGYLYSLNGQTSIEQSDVFGVEKTEISVSASATSAAVKVTGNVAWTATSTATIDKASGEGAGEITVSFPANEDTENAKTYTVTISTDADVQTKSYTVTITQAKAIVAGQTTDIEFVISEIATANSWVNGTKYATIEKDGVTLTATGGSNTGKYYTSGNEWRFYQSENPNLTITVEGGHQFVSSTLTYNVNNDGILVGSDGQTVASGSTSTCTSYTVANSGSATNGQVKFTKIVVTIQ